MAHFWLSAYLAFISPVVLSGHIPETLHITLCYTTHYEIIKTSETQNQSERVLWFFHKKERRANSKVWNSNKISKFPSCQSILKRIAIRLEMGLPDHKILRFGIFLKKFIYFFWNFQLRPKKVLPDDKGPFPSSRLLDSKESVVLQNNFGLYAKEK